MNGQVYFGNYMLKEVICKSELSTIQLAQTSDGQKFALKIYKKMQLRKEKQYHKRKDGQGMTVTDQLMKVMQQEVGTLEYINTHQTKITNVCCLREILENEEKLVLVMDYCEGGQIMQWFPDTFTFKPSNDI